MRPVLLLDVRLVVLLVRPASETLDLAVPAVFVQHPVDELLAVVAVEPFELEGKVPTHLLDGRLDLRRPLAQDRPTLRPTRHQVRLVDRVCPQPLGARPGMAHCVNLRPAGLWNVPRLRLDRDRPPQPPPWLGLAVDLPAGMTFVRRQPPVDRRRTHRQQLSLFLGRQMPAPAYPHDPKDHQLLESHRPRILTVLPDGLEYSHQLLGVDRLASTIFPFIFRMACLRSHPRFPTTSVSSLPFSRRSLACPYRPCRCLTYSLLANGPIPATSKPTILKDSPVTA